jgi:hypothetical protein
MNLTKDKGTFPYIKSSRESKHRVGKFLYNWSLMSEIRNTVNFKIIHLIVWKKSTENTSR